MVTNWVKLLKYQKEKVTNLMTQHIINCTHISFAFIISFSFSFWSHVSISFWYLLYFIFSSSKKCKVFLSYQNDFLIYSFLQSTFFKNNFLQSISLKSTSMMKIIKLLQYSIIFWWNFSIFNTKDLQFSLKCTKI